MQCGNIKMLHSTVEITSLFSLTTIKLLLQYSICKIRQCSKFTKKSCKLYYMQLRMSLNIK